jgi:hypothetical protein
MQVAYCVGHVRPQDGNTMAWWLMLLLAWAVKAQPAAEPLVIDQGGRFGIADRSGKVVLAPIYPSLGAFHKGVAPYADKDAATGNLVAGFVDRTGKPLAKPAFEASRGFSGDRAAVRLGGKWGYVDRKLKQVIAAVYPRALDFADDRALVSADGDVWQIIDPAGKSICSLEAYQVSDTDAYAEGLVVLVDKAKQVAVALDKSCKVAITFPSAHADRFSDGMARFRGEDERYGFVDKSGKVVIPPRFVLVNSFSEGLAAAERDGRWGLVDKHGEWVLEPLFADIDPFSEGLARIRVGVQFGYVDRRGQTVIAAVWDDPEVPATRFSGGVAMVGKVVDGRLLRGWIDKSANPVWVPWPTTAAQ